MKNYRIRKDKINLWVKEIAKIYKIVIPFRDNPSLFKEFNPLFDFSLSPSLPIISPKSFLLPFSEALYKWKEFRKREIILPKEEIKTEVIFGVKKCDMEAISILDCNFKNKIEDWYYLRRRKATLFVVIECNEAGKNCFCETFDIDKKEKGDLILKEEENEFIVKKFNEKGEKLINLGGNLFDKKITTLKERKLKFSRKIYPKKIYLWLEKNWSSSFWEWLSIRCLGCYLCTFICPTCWCFNIQEERRKKIGMRVRKWDSCLNVNFTKMKKENPRKKLFSRIRNRVYHKFKFLKDSFNFFGCVGCGRCFTYCPVGLNVIEILNKVSLNLAF
jgi:formate hydrogenlyase subunit 6/NADH:ubiquinone oxidoreductase subunit I